MCRHRDVIGQASEVGVWQPGRLPTTRCSFLYAHVDNESVVPGQAGWVQNFQHSLRVRLKQLLGSEPDIFWDKTTIRGNDVLAAVIETDLIRCSVLVPIVSPSYVNFERSKWCRRELETSARPQNERAACGSARKAASSRS